MAELLEGFVKDLPTELKDKILERSEGVPLYAVETVRMLADKGVLTQDEGAYHLAGEIGSSDTRHPARPHRLAPRHLVRGAALAPGGRLRRRENLTTASFPLAVAHGGDQNNLENHLRDLVRREFLLFDTDPRSPERGQYGFVQGLTREVAYATLSRRDRSTQHLALARHLESLADDELTSLVAAHYVAAHRAAPEGPEADLIAAAARDWLTRAGRRALSLGSPEQALSFFEQALEVTTSGAERASLLELASDAAEFASAYDRAVALSEEAIAYYEAAGDTNAVGRATVGLAHVLEVIDRFSDVIERCERAFEAVGDGGDERVRANLACWIAYAHGAVGSSERTLEWSERALVLFERLDDSEMIAHVLGAKSNTLFSLGRHKEAIVLARGQVALAEAAGSLLEQGLGRCSVSVFILDDGVREALSTAFEGAELARRAGHRGLEALNLLNGAEFSCYLGEWGDTQGRDRRARTEGPSFGAKGISQLYGSHAGGVHGTPGRGLGLSRTARQLLGFCGERYGTRHLL